MTAACPQRGYRPCASHGGAWGPPARMRQGPLAVTAITASPSAVPILSIDPVARPVKHLLPPGTSGSARWLARWPGARADDEDERDRGQLTGYAEHGQAAQRHADQD